MRWVFKVRPLFGKEVCQTIPKASAMCLNPANDYVRRPKRIDFGPQIEMRFTGELFVVGFDNPFTIGMNGNE